METEILIQRGVSPRYRDALPELRDVEEALRVFLSRQRGSVARVSTNELFKLMPRRYRMDAAARSVVIHHILELQEVQANGSRWLLAEVKRKRRRYIFFFFHRVRA